MAGLHPNFQTPGLFKLPVPIVFLKSQTFRFQVGTIHSLLHTFFNKLGTRTVSALSPVYKLRHLHKFFSFRSVPNHIHVNVLTLQYLLWDNHVQVSPSHYCGEFFYLAFMMKQSS